MRRGFTAQWRGQQNLKESTCPNVFQLHPRRNFQTFDSTLEYLRRGEQWRLSLYCETDDGWHTAGYSVYDFDLHADWIEIVRPHWNTIAARMRTVAPYLKAAGKWTPAPLVEALGLAAEKLPAIDADYRKLRRELGESNDPARVDIEVRRVLHELIAALDATGPKGQQTGVLHKWLNEDGRVLWLCAERHRRLQPRTGK
jgi:hypothetical protein